MIRLLYLLYIAVFAASASAEDRPPNVVFILSDDQAWMDYGFMGHEAIRTPHLDRLAARSLVYERGRLVRDRRLANRARIPNEGAVLPKPLVDEVRALASG